MRLAMVYGMHPHAYLVYLFLQLWITQAGGIRLVYGVPQPMTQFTEWYGQYGFVFAKALRQNCTLEYQNYLYGVGTTFHTEWKGYDEPIIEYGAGSNVSIDYNQGGDVASCITQPLILCILNNTSDYIKSSMASAQVLLGLTPTILALLGPSPMELSLLTVIAKRPFLALLLALACPSVYLGRAFDSTPPLDVLKERPGRRPQWRPKGLKRLGLVIAQYVLALGSLSNVAVLYYQLGVRTICIFWTNGTIVPLLWGLFVLPIHVCAAIVFRLQARRLYSDDVLKRGSFWGWIRGTKKRIWELRKTELVPAALQKEIYIITFPETKKFIAINWLLTPGIIIHVVFGTLVLSSLTFIGPRDALEVVGRFTASMLITRAILMYEIAGVRDRYNSPDGGLVPMLPFEETDDLVLEADNAELANFRDDLEIANPADIKVFDRPWRVPMVKTVPIAAPGDDVGVVHWNSP
ncbi:hypothetical protein F5B18DRAFT_471267 [Nemania serpens]|nr:hypothetical protein F5B18DRAFT_471267 [Nemania serpens]